jgi:hypothetical protein
MVNLKPLQKQAVAKAKNAIANERAYLNDILKMKGMPQDRKDRAIKKYQQAVAAVLETYKNKFQASD